jgi:hypothetical protein
MHHCVFVRQDTTDNNDSHMDLVLHICAGDFKELQFIERLAASALHDEPSQQKTGARLSW